MDPLSKEYLADYYSKLLMLHGDRPEALHWSPEGQKARYDILLKLSDNINQSSIIDYGCGKADLYAHMLMKGIKPRYTGVDITECLINLAKKKYPKCAFMLHDIEEAPLDSDFDFGFVCGVFNNKVEGSRESLYNTTATLFRHIRQGMVVNALSTQTLRKSFELSYTDPKDFLKFARRNITYNTRMDTDTIPGDLFLYIYR